MTEPEKQITGRRGLNPNSRANLKPFVKGQSGNPSGGSKKVAAVQKKAEDFVDEAVAVLAAALKDGDTKTRIMAANAILDRGLGKPKQSVEVNRSPRSLDEINTDDLIAAVHQSRDGDGATAEEACH